MIEVIQRGAGLIAILGALTVYVYFVLWGWDLSNRRFDNWISGQLGRLFRPLVRWLMRPSERTLQRRAEARRQATARRQQEEAKRQEDEARRKEHEEWALAYERSQARQRSRALETLTSSRDPHQLADAVRTLGANSPEVVAALLARGVHR